MAEGNGNFKDGGGGYIYKWVGGIYPSPNHVFWLFDLVLWDLKLENQASFVHFIRALFLLFYVPWRTFGWHLLSTVSCCIFPLSIEK